MRHLLGVVGTPVRDTIVTAAGDELESWGGITYSLATFEALRPDGWGVLPILKVGRDREAEALGCLSELDTVASTDGVRAVPEPTNRVELRYREDGRRTETLSGGVPGWTWPELGPLAGRCDAVYVNFIAGWELDLRAAKSLSEAGPGPLYCDLHSLLLGQDEAGVRVPEPPEDWRAWARCFDFVQLNAGELAMLADREGKRPLPLARELVAGPLRGIFVTLGEDGARWLVRRGEAIEEGSVPVESPVRGRDPTGCGDVWGSACFVSLLLGREPGAAAAQANRAAAVNAGHRGTEGLAAALRRTLEASAPPGGGADAPQAGSGEGTG